MKPLMVVKFGGSLTKDFKSQKKFLKELAEISRKQKVILIHGGGSEINFLLEKFSIKSKFINGLRFTDKEVLSVAEMVLSGKVNRNLVAGLIKNKVKAVGVSAKDANTVICKQIKRLGFVGEPVKVNKKLIEVLLKEDFLPVIASIACDSNANSLNVNADTLTSAIASAFKAQKLVFLTDVCGVLDKDNKTIEEIKMKDVDSLIKNKIITGGMIPKIQACLNSLKKGVQEVWIVDGASGIIKMNGTVIKK
ncbi:MAG: acetylglutamate kinase [Endomicrobium sp.]|jgi:acetylglutamate kinase|nr:acetylglutamate kinase [Endomicrobium sp.]